MLSENDKLRRVLRDRNALIDQLDCAAISKEEFLDRNYHLLCRMQMKPFQTVDSVEKGLYNYQYYNTMAKYWSKCGESATHEKKRKECQNAVANFYHLKDQSILSLLHISRAEPIVAYHVEAQSNRLESRLIEIVYTRQEKMILHTLNRKILDELRRLGVYEETVRRSRIHHYINTGSGNRKDQ